MAAMKTWAVLAAALSCVLASCSGQSAPDEAEPDPIALVKVARVQTGTLAGTTTIYGAVEQGAEARYTLAAPVEATVVSIAAPAGSHVVAGQLVAALRPSPTTTAALAKAQADALAAQQALARAQRLRADGLASDADVETARAAAQGARALSGGLVQQSRSLSLRAPGAGYVSNIAVSAGDLVASGAPVATIARSGDLRARFGIAPAAIARLGRPATLAVQGATGPSRPLPVLSIDPDVDPQSRLASIWVRVPAGTGIVPGEPLTAQVAVPQAGSTPVVPYAALLDDGGQAYVFVVGGGVAHRRDVVAGATQGALVSVISGLKAGEVVVTAGGTAIEDGMKVRTR